MTQHDEYTLQGGHEVGDVNELTAWAIPVLPGSRDWGLMRNLVDVLTTEVERLRAALEGSEESRLMGEQKLASAQAENARLTAQLQAAQEASDDHMQKLAHRVMDVFGNADEDALAEEIMQDVFAAIGLTEAFGAAILDAATDGSK